MPLNYSDYLRLPQLLDLQHPASHPAEHDELLFIVVHQTYELWFKQVLHELDKTGRDFSAGELFPALATLKRVRMILKTLVAQLDILETMTPMSFMAFRERLETASGFQSTQFRELEFLLGFKRAAMLAHVPEGAPGRAAVEQRLAAPSIVDRFHEFVERRGLTIPAALRGKPATETTRPSEELQTQLLEAYRTQPELALLFEQLMDIDEGLQEWRYRHVKIAERTIGNKRGTGGSLGVDFLKRSLFQPIFPDLWAIRHRM